ncbi:MAG TPA: hypothetical protein PLU30_03445 [Verrucomicrobiae bacterium]|nr:hypothetical protein [Verrucomicrobiae bacterium]
MGFAIFVGLLAAIAWFALRRPPAPSVDDQVMEMIRENPSAEVLAPGPGGASEKETPEVLQLEEPQRRSRKTHPAR